MFKSVAKKTKFEFANQCQRNGCHLSFTDLETGKQINIQIDYLNFSKLLQNIQRVKYFFETDNSVVVCEQCGGRLRADFELQSGMCSTCIG